MKTDELNTLEQTALDGPLGQEGADVLDQIERVTKLCADLKDYYKVQLERAPNCIPGWGLKPGANRRVLGDAHLVWKRAQGSLTPEQFSQAVKVEAGKLEGIWASVNAIPASQAKAKFAEFFGELVTIQQNAPSLVRTK